MRPFSAALAGKATCGGQEFYGRPIIFRIVAKAIATILKLCLLQAVAFDAEGFG
jgi:hypothetical protein